MSGCKLLTLAVYKTPIILHLYLTLQIMSCLNEAGELTLIYCVLQRCVRCLHKSCQISGFRILVFQWKQVYTAAHGCQHTFKDSMHRWRRMLLTLSLSSHAMESGLCVFVCLKKTVKLINVNFLHLHFSTIGFPCLK